MGLKQDLIDAITSAYVDTNPGGDSSDLPDVSDGSYPERLAHYQTEAIVKFLENAEFRITKLNAPVVVETFKLPERFANVAVETLLGEYKPLIKALKKLGDPLGLSGVIDSLEGEIRDAVSKVVEGGVTVPPTDVSKDDGGLESTGYVFIGDPPDSESDFDVGDEDGQRTFTTVKLIREDIEDLL